MRALAIVSIVLLAGSLSAQDRPRNSLDRLFQPQGIKLTTEQKKTLTALQEDLTAKTREIQQKLNEIYTREQRAVRREAIKAVRDAGKNGREAQKAVDAAVKLSKEQEAKLSELQNERNELLAKAQAGRSRNC